MKINSINDLDRIIRALNMYAFGEIPENMVIKSDKILKQMSKAFKTMHEIKDDSFEIKKGHYKGITIEKE